MVVIVDEFHDMEILGQQVLSFSEERVRQVENIHFFESLNNGTGFSLVKNSDDSLLLELTLDAFVNDLEFGVEFGTHDGVFTGSVEQTFTDLILGSVDIGKFTHVDLGMFGDESEDVQVINNQNVSLLNESIVEIGVDLDGGHASGGGQINGRLFSSFVTFTNPISSMEIIIPISCAIGGGEGDDKQRLFNHDFFNSSGSFSFFGARESKDF